MTLIATILRKVILEAFIQIPLLPRDYFRAIKNENLIPTTLISTEKSVSPIIVT